MKEIEILREGSFTANDGSRHTFTQTELQEIAETYDPANFKAPLILSHKTKGVADKEIANSHLAYGFPNSLRVVGDRLKATFENVAPQFVQWVRDGNVLSVSSSLYTPESPVNPYPGKWSLRHIAGLGSEPPAIKGMAALSLSEGVMEFEEPDGDGAVGFAVALDFGGGNYQIKNILQNLREWFIEKYDLDTANRILPMHSINAMAMGEDCGCNVQNVRAELDQLSSEYTDYGEPDMAEKFKKKKMEDYLEEEDLEMMDEDEDDEVDMSEYVQRLKDLELRAQAAELKLKRNEITSFTEGLATNGQLTPALTGEFSVDFDESHDEIDLNDFLLSLSEPQLDFVKQFLSALPKSVDYGEYVAPTVASTVPSFAAMSRSEQFDAANAYAQEHEISFEDAYVQLGRNS